MCCSERGEVKHAQNFTHKQLNPIPSLSSPRPSLHSRCVGESAASHHPGLVQATDGGKTPSPSAEMLNDVHLEKGTGGHQASPHSLAVKRGLGEAWCLCSCQRRAGQGLLPWCGCLECSQKGSFLRVTPSQSSA